MSPSTSGRGFLGRLWRWMAWTLGIFILLTVLPVLAMRWWDPLGSAFMVQARVEAIGAKEKYQTRYRWVDYERISPEARLAVVASEDQFFPVHYGFDFKSIQKAMEEGEQGKRVRGASTISQQVAKNLFLWSGKNFLRKGLEAWFTVLIEALWPKQRILEIYLNIAQFGRGVYGVEAAARQYFGKPAAKINREEAALLAAVLPNPIRLRVDRPSRYVRSRQQWVMSQMRGLGGHAYLRELEGSAAR